MDAMNAVPDRINAIDQKMHEVRLCGSARTIAAVNAIRDDVLEIIRMLGRGDWRFIDSKRRTELLNAFRVDLGYQETEILARPDTSPEEAAAGRSAAEPRA